MRTETTEVEYCVGHVYHSPVTHHLVYSLVIQNLNQSEGYDVINQGGGGPGGGGLPGSKGCAKSMGLEAGEERA